MTGRSFQKSSHLDNFLSGVETSEVSDIWENVSIQLFWKYIIYTLRGVLRECRVPDGVTVLKHGGVPDFLRTR